MAEFKFHCPRCSRQIQCDTGYAGTQINCPACQQPITVPSAAQTEGPPAGKSPEKANRKKLFVASTILVLVAIVAGAGWFLFSGPRGKPAGLVAWWRAEGNAQDSVGDNNGTLAGGAGFASGVVGEAFSFNGTSSCVSIPDSPLLDSFTDRITIELWLKANQLTANSDWESVVSKGNAAWEIQTSARVKAAFFYLGGPNPSHVDGSRNVNDGQWHHVAAVYDGTHIFLYVDGTLDASTPATGRITPNNYPMGVGYNAQGVSGHPAYFFDGLVDEVSLYDRALSAREIAAIYRTGARGKFQ